MPVTGVSVVVTPRLASVGPGGAVSFTAAVSGAPTPDVSWSVREAGGGTVDSSGRYKAPANLGTFHVVATSVVDPSKADAATVTVTSATVVAVSVSPHVASAVTGGSVSFTASVTGTSAGQSTAVTWSVQETGGGTVDNLGHYVAPGTTGTYHVVATSVADTSKSDAATATVASTPVVTVSISPQTASVVTGGALTFTATVTGTTPGQSTAVTWSVQEAGGGSVDASGHYTAPGAAGTYHVVATSVADATKKSTATVTVTPPPPIAVSISPQIASVVIRGTLAFTATVTGTSNTSVTWSVQEGPTGGSVDSTGHYTAPASSGTFHVVVTSVADPTKSAQATVIVTASPPPGGATAMALISRTVPATSSSGTASWAQDTSYGGIEWGFHTAEIGVGWVTYDLSAVPAAQRRQLLVALYLGKGDQYYQLNYRAAVWTPEFIPDAYVLEGATSSSGPWTALVTVTVNNNPFKSHLIGDFSPYSFLRFRVTSSANGCRVKMDVYDASQGIGDGFVFYGDSITTNIFSGGFIGYGPEWFSKPIQASHSAFFPFLLGGGYPFITSGDGVDLIVTDSGTNFSAGLSTPLKTIFQYAKFAALIFGANDAPAQSLVDQFRANYTQIINALRGNGQTVVLAAPTWATDSTRQAGLVQIRAAIGFQLPNWAAGSFTSGTYVWNGTRAYLCTTSGTSMTGPTGTGTNIADGGTARWSYVPSLREDYASDPGVIGGPDLYSVFLNHPEWLNPDGLHPNTAGEVQWRAAWINWALANVYR